MIELDKQTEQKLTKQCIYAVETVREGIYERLFKPRYFKTLSVVDYIADTIEDDIEGYIWAVKETDTDPRIAIKNCIDNLREEVRTEYLIGTWSGSWTKFFDEHQEELETVLMDIDGENYLEYVIKRCKPLGVNDIKIQMVKDVLYVVLSEFEMELCEDDEKIDELWSEIVK